MTESIPAYRQKRYGPDRIHHALSAELPPVAAEYKRVMARVYELRRQMRTKPTDSRWNDWYKKAEQLLDRRQELVPMMRDLGYRVHARRQGLPTESLHDIRLRMELDSEARAKQYSDPTKPIEGWEAFSSGADDIDNLPKFHHRDPATGNKQT